MGLYLLFLNGSTRPQGLFLHQFIRFTVSRYERTGSDGLFQSKLFAHSMISVGRSQQFRDIYFYHSILLHTPSMYLVFTFLDHNQVSPHQNICISASSWDCSVVSTALFVNGSFINFWTQDIIHGIAYASIYGGTFLIFSLHNPLFWLFPRYYLLILLIGLMYTNCSLMTDYLLFFLSLRYDKSFGVGSIFTRSSTLLQDEVYVAVQA
jgi:hypothetical protein